MAEKKINYEIVPQQHEAYRVLTKMRKYHLDAISADIRLAWQDAMKPDQDGHLVLGRCVKISDLQREFNEFDFVIVLNREAWDDPDFTMDKKEALIDHELCHVGSVEDDDGAKYDDRGRRVWRTKKHDIEEFQEIVVRHGCYKRDLERFAEALIKRRKSEPSLFDEEQTAAGLKIVKDGLEKSEAADAEIFGADDGPCVSCNNRIPFEDADHLRHMTGVACTRGGDGNATLASAREVGGTHQKGRRGRRQPEPEVPIPSFDEAHDKARRVADAEEIARPVH